MNNNAMTNPYTLFNITWRYLKKLRSNNTQFTAAGQSKNNKNIFLLIKVTHNKTGILPVYPC